MSYLRQKGLHQPTGGLRVIGEPIDGCKHNWHLAAIGIDLSDSSRTPDTKQLIAEGNGTEG